MQGWLDRAVELLYATKEILEKAKEGPYVIDVLSTLATWDGTECDGYCLLDDITALLEEIQSFEDEERSSTIQETKGSMVECDRDDAEVIKGND